jgi:hypothetical protein
MLPKNLKYGSKVESASARSYRTNIAPQNGTGTYSLGDTIIINIPTRNNLVLVPTESYLKFNATVTTSGNGVVARWDSCGAHGLIQRVRVFHGSNLLSDIDSYGLLAKMLFDLQVAPDSAYGKLNVLAGTRNDLVSNLPTIATIDATTAETTLALANALKASFNTSSISGLQINAGDSLGTSIQAAAPVTNTYCLNLISLVGTLCSANYLPLFAMTSAPLRVEIQLVSSGYQAMASSGAIASIGLTNVEYIGNFIELGDQAMSMVYGSLQGSPLQFVVPDYRNYQYSYQLPDAITQCSFPIPAKFSSLKSLFITIRESANINTATYFPYSSVTRGIQDIQFRVGATLMPTKAVNTLPEMFAEVLKAMGSMSDLNYSPSIEKLSYSLAASAANSVRGNTSSGSFYLGLDLENYCASQKDTIFAGYNSNTDDIFAIMNFGAQGGNVTARFDAFALFDEVVVFENNTAYVKF